MTFLKWFFADFINPPNLYGDLTPEDCARMLAWVIAFLLLTGLTACTDNSDTSVAGPVPARDAIPASSLTAGVDYYDIVSRDALVDLDRGCTERIGELERLVKALQAENETLRNQAKPDRTNGRTRRKDGAVRLATATDATR